MSTPLSLFVGLRYTLARKRNLFLSLVSLISMLGISLGVLILIVALAVINGSIDTLRREVLKSVPHVTISGSAIATDWQRSAAHALMDERVLAVAPFLEGEATIRYQGGSAFVRLRGIAPELEMAVVDSPGARYRESLEALQRTDNGIVPGVRLGSALAMAEGGDASVTALGSLLSRSLADSQGFQVAGFADFGVYGNGDVALVNLSRARELFAADALQLRLRVDDIFEAQAIARELFGDEEGIVIEAWNEAQASLFNALNMEKILTGFMLLMIVVIGAVNIVSTLVMAVADKGADIAILRTMGASRGLIMRIFVVQGLIAGAIGAAVGAFLGVLFANNLSSLSLALERLLNTLFSGANIYLISHLRTEVNFSEVLLVCLAALAISFIATLYPAWRAGNIRPAEVLRYE